MTAEKATGIELAIETFGEAPEKIVGLQVEHFLTTREEARRFAERFKQAYMESVSLLKVDPESITDEDLRRKLEKVQHIYRGNGGQ